MRRTFLGVSFSAIDPQRRILMPKNWRLDGDSSDTVYYLMPGPEGEIRVCSTEYFNEQMELMGELNPSDPETQRALELVGELTQAVVPDKQGRFALSPEIMEYGGFTKRVVLAGKVTFGRIVPEEKWQKDEGRSAVLKRLDESLHQERQKRRGQGKNQNAGEN